MTIGPNTATPSVTAPAAPGSGNQITIDGFAFAPAMLTISAGTSVTWVNRDEEPHTVVAGDGSFHSPGMGTGATFSHGEPYVVALVDLDEGVRMMTNIVGCPPEDVRIGMAVTVTWEPLSDGRQLPLFTPTSESTSASQSTSETRPS